MPADGIHFNGSNAEAMRANFLAYARVNRRNTEQLIVDDYRKFATDLYVETAKIAPTRAEIAADVKALGWKIPRKFADGRLGRGVPAQWLGHALIKRNRRLRKKGRPSKAILAAEEAFMAQRPTLAQMQQFVIANRYNSRLYLASGWLGAIMDLGGSLRRTSGKIDRARGGAFVGRSPGRADPRSPRHQRPLRGPLARPRRRHFLESHPRHRHDAGQDGFHGQSRAPPHRRPRRLYHPQTGRGRAPPAESRMSTPQEVRQTWIWDTGSVEKGEKVITRAYERTIAAEKAARRHGAGGGGGGGNNFAMGIRDLAEGRGLNAMQRFGHVIGGTALRLAGYMLAVRAAGEATRYLREELEKTDSASKRLEASMVVSHRTAIGSSSAEAPASLSAKIAASREGTAAENEQQVNIQRVKDTIDKGVQSNNPFSVGVHGTHHMLRVLMGHRSQKEEIEASKERGAMHSKNMDRYRGMRSMAYGRETEIAAMNGPGGNPHDAKVLELKTQRQLELSQAATNELTKEDILNIKKRYEILIKTAEAEHSIFLGRQAYRSENTAIQHSARSAFSKSTASTAARMRQSQSMIDSGLLTDPQRIEEENNLQQARGQNRDAIMARYLNPDGTKRRHGAILRDFRKDRRTERLQARFQRRYDAGGIDPETGRAVVTGDTPGSGLRSGSVQGAQGGLDSPQGSNAVGEKGWGEIFKILDQRLPKDEQ